MSREHLVQIAKMAELTEQYTDMVDAMKEIVGMDGILSAEERNLLSIAYKYVVGHKRSAWRVLSSLEAKSEGERYQSVCSQYRRNIENQLKDLCRDILRLLDTSLLPASDRCEGNYCAETNVFYLKMKGDYHRYLAEVTSEEERKEAEGSAHLAYITAYDLANEHMEKLNPVRLGLMLNLSVFYYEISGETTKACEIANEAFETVDIDQLRNEAYRDSMLIMQLIRDNLELWKSEQGDTGVTLDDDDGDDDDHNDDNNDDDDDDKHDIQDDK